MVRGAPDFYRVTREKGTETEFIGIWGTIDAGETRELGDWPAKDVTVSMLELGSDTNKMTLNIFPYKVDGTTPRAITGASKAGGGMYTITSENIHTHDSILWYELFYDTTQNWNKFGLGYPIRMANGCIIYLKNADTTTKAFAIAMLILTRT